MEAMKSHPWEPSSSKTAAGGKATEWPLQPGVTQGWAGTSSALRRRLQERLTGAQYLTRSWQTSRCEGKGSGFLSPGS